MHCFLFPHPRLAPLGNAFWGFVQPPLSSLWYCGLRLVFEFVRFDVASCVLGASMFHRMLCVPSFASTPPPAPPPCPSLGNSFRGFPLRPFSTRRLQYVGKICSCWNLHSVVFSASLSVCCCFLRELQLEVFKYHKCLPLGRIRQTARD